MKKGRLARILAGALAAVSLFGVAGCGLKKTPEGELIVYAPDGAPALALAGLMNEDREDDGVTYRIVSPSVISTKVTNDRESENADLCVLPITAASKLLGDGERYQVLGTVTHGNLYLLAKEEVVWTGAQDLVNKTVGVLQIKEVPGLTFKATLQKAGLSYSEITNEGGRVENTVALQAITGADAVGTVDAEYFLLAEPAASLQKKKGYKIVENIQTLYGGEKGYPQAVLVAKRSLIQSRGEWVEDFCEQLLESEAWLKTASGETLVSLLSSHLEDKTAATSLKAPALTEEVVARCGIYFTYADACVAETERFLTDLIAVNSKAAAMPAPSFYWQR